MVEHFPPDRANQPFSICVLPWRSWRSWSVTNAHRTKPSDVCLAISAIAITNDVIRRSLPAASLRQLSSDPFSRRVCRYSQPHDSTSTVPENQKAIQQPERKCWHDEQVHRSDAVSVLAKKGPPALRGPSPLPGHVFCNARLADIDAEFEQFAMDAGCTAARVGQVHVPNQPTDLQRHPRSPAAPSGFPAPERLKSSTVPTNHGLGPDDGQRVYCARNEAIQPNEHQSVEIAENKSLGGFAPQHIDPLPEN